MKLHGLLLLATGIFFQVLLGCAPSPTSNDVQRDRQNKILDEAAAQVGLPSIKNFREFKIMKMIYELRDQEGLVTFTYGTVAKPNFLKN